MDGQNVHFLAQTVGHGGVDLVVGGLRGGMERGFSQQQHHRVGQVAEEPPQNPADAQHQPGKRPGDPVFSEEGADPAKELRQPVQQQRTVEEVLQIQLLRPQIHIFPVLHQVFADEQEVQPHADDNGDHRALQILPG